MEHTALLQAFMEKQHVHSAQIKRRHLRLQTSPLQRLNQLK
jgi:hypothetical protein